MSVCNRCNRPLRTQKSIDEGYGPVCKRKQFEADEEFEKIQMTLEETMGQEMSESNA